MIFPGNLHPMLILKTLGAIREMTKVARSTHAAAKLLEQRFVKRVALFTRGRNRRK